jgi:hypothetical protein
MHNMSRTGTASRPKTSTLRGRANLRLRWAVAQGRAGYLSGPAILVTAPPPVFRVSPAAYLRSSQPHCGAEGEEGSPACADAGCCCRCASCAACLAAGAGCMLVMTGSTSGHHLSHCLSTCMHATSEWAVVSIVHHEPPAHSRTGSLFIALHPTVCETLGGS